jgi:hypothetical protein
MMIVDAVNSAPSQHAVYFLVTAYLESLRHFERTCGVPQRVIELPVASATDLSERLEALRRTRDAMSESTVVVSEVSAVLSSALSRLDMLCVTTPGAVTRPAMHLVKSDSRRSLLSV